MVGLLAAVCVAGLTTSAVATEVTTTGFGTIPGASGNPYSGSGIPFDTSQWTQVSGIPSANALHPDTLTIAMAATQHGSGNRRRGIMAREPTQSIQAWSVGGQFGTLTFTPTALWEMLGRIRSSSPS